MVKHQDHSCHGDHEPPPLGIPMNAQVTIDEIVEHMTGGLANREVYASPDWGNEYIIEHQFGIQVQMTLVE